jgi:hypothetical protein
MADDGFGVPNTNDRPLGGLASLGDPERWGASQKLQQSGTAGTTNPITLKTPVFVRANASQLLARAWDFFAAWQFSVTNFSAASMFIDTAIGVGSSTGFTSIFLQDSARADFDQNFSVQPFFGTSQLASPLIGSTIHMSLRAVIVPAAPGPWSLDLRVYAAIAPRTPT